MTKKRRKKRNYEDYSNLIFERAWHWLNLFPDVDFDDLVQQGGLAFCEAQKSFDSKRGAGFVTHLYWQVNFRMGYFCKRHGDWSFPENQEDMDIYLSNHSPERIASFKEMIHNLSTEAKEVVEIIFNSPEEIARITLGTIKKELRLKGWKFKEIQIAFDEIKSGLASI